MEYEILDTDFADDPRQDPHHVGDDDASLHSVRSIVEGDVQVEDGAHVATPSHVDRSTRTRESIRHLSRVEKQARQRAQNRKAAEKSRHKKKVEQTSLEMTVNNIQEENITLRARLSRLLAAQTTPGPRDLATSINPQTPTTSAGTGTGTGVDYVYLSRLQSELSSAKSTLLELELELAGLRGAENSNDVDVARHLLLSHHTTLSSLQAEANSLETVIGHLRNERDELAKQTEVVGRELEARKALRGAGEGAEEEQAANAVGVERALLDIRGWVDLAVKNWEQTSILPGPRDGEGSEDPPHGA